jgi:hypothetical protein
MVLPGPPVTYAGPPSGPVAPPVPPPPPAQPLPLCESSGKPSPCVQPPDAYRHDGFYLRFGGGFGYGQFSGSGPAGSASVSGLSGESLFAIGGNVGEGFVVAGVVHGVQVRETLEGSPPPARKATLALGQLGVLVDWFPDPTGGWHVGGLAGLGLVGISDAATRDSGTAVVADGGGFSFGGGLLGGYDFWIGPQWSAGLYVIATGAGSTAMLDRQGDKTGYSFGAWSLGVQYAFTLH